ncbi:fimbria/pilus periplasmic chaperone [Escherichia coli]|uniref:Fimbria/pilus periplasmic chaperone n=1 Tax=Escherichia coli TaxID=562 RepID=A0AAI9FH13_ECOLX|nr:fimbria/pilus periplasmic chaperone [Escherichia coli]HDQ6535512.1 fimbria/pilus periplasmic chaperone [Escherichia coli O36:H14]ANO92591.1 putative chaperone AfaB [Escherichia coli]EFI5800292.1 fimbria/pilus periplasmic chaperone [Escherichia coli]EFI6955363.1 fimbria/pilus periplasmic chaperone [Escherichia coli]EFM3830554.1 fimbria/pilus periplasmic chaperone [Escherichia coli]
MRGMVVFMGMLTGILPLIGGASAAAFATENEEGRKTNPNMFSLHLGATRVIYNPVSSGETLTIINDRDYPMLVQSEVLSEDRKSPAPFVVTPPLFRLDGKQSSRLRIVRTGGDFPMDRESLQWVCVKGIPPKVGDKWAGEQDRDKKKTDQITVDVQMSVSSCIKLFVRPPAVKGRTDDVAGKVEWQKVGNRLKGTNPTPFYINLSELKVGDKNVNEHHYIAPFSSYEYPIPAGADGKVQWKVVMDHGGTSKWFEMTPEGRLQE